MTGSSTDSPTCFFAAKWMIESTECSSMAAVRRSSASAAARSRSTTSNPSTRAVRPVEKSSTTRTSSPRSVSSLTTCEPIYPAPPVTRTAMARALLRLVDSSTPENFRLQNTCPAGEPSLRPAAQAESAVDNASEFPTALARTAGRCHSGKMHVLLISDPGPPSRCVASIKDEFSELLRQDFDAEVTVDVCTETLRVQADHRLELSTLDSIVDRFPGADLVIMLTDIPRHTQGKPLIAEVLPDRNVAVISHPTLGAPTKRRLLKIYMSCLNQLLPDEHLPAQRHRLPRWGQWSSRADSGRRTLHSPTSTGGPRLVLGMTMANEPPGMARNLSRPMAAAAATGAFGIFYSSIWQMSHHLSTLRLISIGVIAIALMVGWLITINRLWDRPVKERLAQVVFYYNLSTVLTLIICVTSLYAILVVGILAGGLIVIDPEFMAQTINRPEARLNNYLDIAWLSAAMGVVAGALGSSFDSDIDVRNLTHSQRLRARVHTVDSDETDKD